MRSSASKIQLSGFEDLFQTNGKTEASGERVQEIPLSELFPFKDHPFQVWDDDAMRETADSIAKYGVLVPGIVRPRQEGGYEIVAGHRRKRGSELAVLHRPADGRSHCVPAGKLETPTNLKEPPQQSTTISIAGAAFLRLQTSQ